MSLGDILQWPVLGSDNTNSKRQKWQIQPTTKHLKFLMIPDIFLYKINIKCMYKSSNVFVCWGFPRPSPRIMLMAKIYYKENI